MSVQAVSFFDGPNVDAFSRLRISSNNTDFDSKMSHDKQPLFWDEVVTGSGASSVVSDSEVTMSVTESGDSVVRQTFMRFLYQPGKSKLIEMTGTLAPEDGVIKRCGYFDANNGIGFEMRDGAAFGFIRKGGVDSYTELNPFAVYAESISRGFTDPVIIDWTKSQILFFDFQYLALGRVRWGVNVDGQPFYLDQNLHANREVGPYMLRSNLPLRYEIESTGGAGSMTQICCGCFTEGGTDETGILRFHSNGITHVDATTAGTNYLLAAIRLKSTHLDGIISLQSASVISLTNDNFFWSLLLNPTIAGTPSWTSKANSCVETTVGATANTVTGGVDIYGQYGYMQSAVSGQLNFKSTLRAGAKIDGTADILALCFMPLGSGSVNADALGCIGWREIL
jgi:hypothetical protein